MIALSPRIERRLSIVGKVSGSRIEKNDEQEHADRQAVDRQQARSWQGEASQFGRVGSSALDLIEFIVQQRGCAAAAVPRSRQRASVFHRQCSVATSSRRSCRRGTPAPGGRSRRPPRNRSRRGHALAPRERPREQPVDLGLGADVDARGRVLEDEHLGRDASQRANDLLLVAARQRLDRRVGIVRPQADVGPEARLSAASAAARRTDRGRAPGLRNMFSRTDSRARSTPRRGRPRRSRAPAMAARGEEVRPPAGIETAGTLGSTPKSARPTIS